MIVTETKLKQTGQGHSALPFRPLTGGWLLQTTNEISYSDSSTWGDSNNKRAMEAKGSQHNISVISIQRYD